MTTKISYAFKGLAKLTKGAMNITEAYSYMLKLDSQHNYEYMICALKVNPPLISQAYEMMSIRKIPNIEKWNGEFKNKETLGPTKDVALRDIIIHFSNKSADYQKAWLMVKRIFFNNSDDNINKYMADKWNKFPPFTPEYDQPITFSVFLDKYVGENVFCEQYITINGEKIREHYPCNKIIGPDMCRYINGAIIQKLNKFILFTTYTCLEGKCVLNHESKHSLDGKKLLDMRVNAFYNGMIDGVDDDAEDYIRELITTMDERGVEWDVTSKQEPPEELKPDAEKKQYVDKHMEKLCDDLMDIDEATVFMAELDKYRYFECMLYMFILYPREMVDAYKSISFNKKLNIEKWDGNFEEVRICDKFNVTKDQMLHDLVLCTSYEKFLKSKAWLMIRKIFFNDSDGSVKKYMRERWNK